MARRREFKITVKVSDEPVDVEAFLERYARLVVEQYEAEQRAAKSPKPPRDTMKPPLAKK